MPRWHRKRLIAAISPLLTNRKRSCLPIGIPIRALSILLRGLDGLVMDILVPVGNTRTRTTGSRLSICQPQWVLMVSLNSLKPLYSPRLSLLIIMVGKSCVSRYTTKTETLMQSWSCTIVLWCKIIIGILHQRKRTAITNTILMKVMKSSLSITKMMRTSGCLTVTQRPSHQIRCMTIHTSRLKMSIKNKMPVWRLTSTSLTM